MKFNLLTQSDDVESKIQELSFYIDHNKRDL
jgi:hypothetical protein